MNCPFHPGVLLIKVPFICVFFFLIFIEVERHSHEKM